MAEDGQTIRSRHSPGLGGCVSTSYLPSLCLLKDLDLLPSYFAFILLSSVTMAQVDNKTDLTHFKALSFDCYGTLIDWLPNLLRGIQPVLAHLPADHPFARDPLAGLRRFDEIANVLEVTQPTLKKDLNLTTALREFAAELGITDGNGDGSSRLTDADLAAMGSGPGRWDAFPDTVAALNELKRHYKLILLSNIDNVNIAGTVTGPLGGVDGGFDAVYTAEDIGSYKPSHKNFEYLFRRARDELGVDVDKGELLHVARGLKVDHTAAREMGFKSCWISRGGDRKEGYGVGGDYDDMIKNDKVSFQWKFDTLGDFAEEVKRQFAKEQEEV